MLVGGTNRLWVALVVAVVFLVSLWYLGTERSPSGLQASSGSAVGVDVQSEFAAQSPLSGAARIPASQEDTEVASASMQIRGETPSIAACLVLGTRGEREACLAEQYQLHGREVFSFLGQEVCSGNPYAFDVMIESGVILVELASHDRLVRCLDLVFRSCGDFRAADYCRTLIRHLSQSRPDLADALELELTPQEVFDSSLTHFGVMGLAEFALLRDDDGTKELLVQGATGEHGGSSRQIDFAALYSARVLDHSERISLLERVCQSANLPASVRYEGMGSTLAHLILRPRPGDTAYSSESTSALLQLMDHPILGSSAVFHLASESLERPSFFDSQTWDEIVAHARMLDDL